MVERISLHDVELTWQAVADTAYDGRGGITRAARKFGVKGDVVTRAITRVERAFGGNSFFLAKERRGSQLTPAGRLFHFQGKSMLDEWRRLSTELAEVEGRAAD